MQSTMENKTQSKQAENDKGQIKAINEDTYWTKEYGIAKEHLQGNNYNTGIYDIIVDAHIKTQKSGN
jgi:hypothetical protein